jgi:hypothetical protein
VKLEKKGRVVATRENDGIRFELSPNIAELQRARVRNIVIWSIVGFAILFLLVLLTATAQA